MYVVASPTMAMTLKEYEVTTHAVSFCLRKRGGNRKRYIQSSGRRYKKSDQISWKKMTLLKAARGWIQQNCGGDVQDDKAGGRAASGGSDKGGFLLPRSVWREYPKQLLG